MWEAERRGKSESNIDSAPLPLPFPEMNLGIALLCFSTTTTHTPLPLLVYHHRTRHSMPVKIHLSPTHTIITCVGLRRPSLVVGGGGGGDPEMCVSGRRRRNTSARNGEESSFLTFFFFFPLLRAVGGWVRERGGQERGPITISFPFPPPRVRWCLFYPSDAYFRARVGFVNVQE